MTPLVSIVIANFNYGRFLGEAIESALAQTHPRLEVLVVDDGSTDDSRDVAARYSVRLLEQENAGVARARNRGANEARGELVVFLDADDVLEPSFVERCWSALATAPADVAYAYTQMQLFGDEDAVFASREFHGPELLRNNFVPVTCLLRRDVFLAAGGFDPRFRAYEDWELWLRLFARGHRGVLVPEPLLRYRRHGRTRDRISHDDAVATLWEMRAANPRASWRYWLRSPLAMARAARRLHGARRVADRR